MEYIWHIPTIYLVGVPGRVQMEDSEGTEGPGSGLGGGGRPGGLGGGRPGTQARQRAKPGHESLGLGLG